MLHSFSPIQSVFSFYSMNILWNHQTFYGRIDRYPLYHLEYILIKIPSFHSKHVSLSLLDENSSENKYRSVG